MQRDSEHEMLHLRRRGPKLRRPGGPARASWRVVFLVTVVKVRTGGFAEGFDHVVRPADPRCDRSGRAMIARRWPALTPNGRVVAATVGTVIGMGSLGWAAVPLYDLFCRVTGYGGTTARAEAGATPVLDRTIKVRFDASRERGMPWEFRPRRQREMDGPHRRDGLAFYEATNPTDAPVAGHGQLQRRALSGRAAFREDRLLLLRGAGAGCPERRSMPVTFYVDPGDGRRPRRPVHARDHAEPTPSTSIDLPEDYAALMGRTIRAATARIEPRRTERDLPTWPHAKNHDYHILAAVDLAASMARSRRFFMLVGGRPVDEGIHGSVALR